MPFPTNTVYITIQTLNSISAKKNSTIVYPIPIDIINKFMEEKEKKRKENNNSTLFILFHLPSLSPKYVYNMPTQTTAVTIHTVFQLRRTAKLSSYDDWHIKELRCVSEKNPKTKKWKIFIQGLPYIQLLPLDLYVTLGIGQVLYHFKVVYIRLTNMATFYHNFSVVIILLHLFISHGRLKIWIEQSTLISLNPKPFELS